MSSQYLEEAQKHVPSQQLLVNIVSRRVRQLSSGGHRPLVEYGPREGWADIALKEIIEGKLQWQVAGAERSEDEA
jgi:DNA-directed RNA polymerase subunit omega